MKTFTGGSYNRYLEHRRSRTFDQPALDGYSAVLNFINTSKNLKGKDYLQDYAAFLHWCYKAAIINEDTYEDLNLEAYCYFNDADTLFKEIMEARETLTDLFDAVQSGKEALTHVAPRFNRLVATVTQHISYDYCKRQPL